MKKIDISVLRTDTLEWEKIGSVILENGAITFRDLPEKFIREMETFGVVGRAEGGVLFPRDGEKFMDALVEETGRCSMVRASIPVSFTS